MVNLSPETNMIGERGFYHEKLQFLLAKTGPSWMIPLVLNPFSKLGAAIIANVHNAIRSRSD